MQQELPSSIDLRSNIDSVYNQNPDNACGAHAVLNALEAQLDLTGNTTRYSRSWLWWWIRVYTGQTGTNTGSTVEAINTALKNHGMVTEEMWPWSNAYVTPPDAMVPVLSGIEYCERSPVSSVEDIKRLLCLGVAPVLLFQVYTGFMNLSNNRNWRTHDWDFSEGYYFGEHFVTIVGYDDAAQRFLVENSWGPDWGDGGFFGIPYSKIFTPGFYSNLSHIDYIKGIQFKPAENFMTAPYFLLPTESSGFILRSKSALKNLLVQSYGSGDIQSLVNTCVEWGVSDKHLELLMQWERRTVRNFKDTTPGIDWSGFTFDTI